MEKQKWTINAIKRAVQQAGSNWFDPDSMRAFNSRILSVVYHGPGGIFFVSSESMDSVNKKYSVRQFHPDSKNISTVGAFNTLTKKRAIKLARESASTTPSNGVNHEEEFEIYEKFHPISDLEQFIFDLQKHGNPNGKIEDARQLIVMAKKHQANADEMCCSTFHMDEEDLDGLRESITKVAYKLGAKSVIFSNDPRGCTVKLEFNNNHCNDWGNIGYCVPCRS